MMKEILGRRQNNPWRGKGTTEMHGEQGIISRACILEFRIMELERWMIGLGALAALEEDLSSVSSHNMVVHSHL